MTLSFTPCSARTITVTVLQYTATHPVSCYHVTDEDGQHIGYCASVHRSHSDREIISQGPVTLTNSEQPAVDALVAQLNGAPVYAAGICY